MYEEVAVTDDDVLVRIAVKQYVAVDPQSPIARSFWVEDRVHSKVSHRNICRFLGMTKAGNLYRAKYELCDHGTALDRRGTPEVLAIVRGVCAALGYLHDRGVAHRDVKPHNILVKGGVAKLADFGLATDALPASTIAGTPNYIAPEVLAIQRGGPPYTCTVDLWSLGATIQILRGGDPPFKTPSVPRTYARIRALEVTRLPPDPETAAIVRRLLVPAADRASLVDVVEWAHSAARSEAAAAGVEERAVLDAVDEDRGALGKPGLE